MKAVLAGAKPILDLRIDESVQRAAMGPEAQAQSLKQIAAWLAKFSDPVGREIRVESVARGLQLPPDLVRRALGGGRASPSIQPAPLLKPAQPAGRPAQRPTPPLRRPEKLSPRDRTLLTALAWGNEFAPIFAEARAALPPELTAADLFDYPPARAWVGRLVGEPGYFELFRATPAEVLTADMDPQLRVVLTEACLSKTAPLEASEVRHALGRGVLRALERFSQSIQTAIADAEAKKDAGLEAQRKQEYLDVQRRIKEFSSFYDEA
jgi:hypothetical protein